MTDFIDEADLDNPRQMNGIAVAEAVQSLDSLYSAEFLGLLKDSVVKQVIMIGTFEDKDSGKTLYWMANKSRRSESGCPIIPSNQPYAEDPTHVACRLLEVCYKELEAIDIVRLTDLIERDAHPREA